MQSLASVDNDWLVRIDAAGFEEAAEQAAAIGQLSSVQLEPGPVRVQGAIARLGRAVAGRFSGDRNRTVTLQPLPGRLVLLVAARGTARLGTADIHPGDVVVVSRSTRLVMFNDRYFTPACISLDAGDLARAAADLEIDLPSPPEVGLLRAPGVQAMALDQLVQGFMRVAEIAPGSLQSSGVMTVLEETITQWCAALLHKARDWAPIVERSSSRRRAALRAREFIDTHLDEPLSLARVCRASYACARALEYGFRELFETTPMAYVRCARLSQVRRELYCAKKSRRTVTRLATRWGFGHLGQFSRDYHSLFGELPSATLARATSESEDTQPIRSSALGSLLTPRLSVAHQACAELIATPVSRP